MDIKRCSWSLSWSFSSCISWAKTSLCSVKIRICSKDLRTLQTDRKPMYGSLTDADRHLFLLFFTVSNATGNSAVMTYLCHLCQVLWALGVQVPRHAAQAASCALEGTPHQTQLGLLGGVRTQSLLTEPCSDLLQLLLETCGHGCWQTTLSRT